ncbi:putative glucuronosyltransferase PGSIP8 [Impatiens glandulifera]|uniref:putative glucuronosyltransferase PGSIP8 n=1 Tax=Impatiens glandulifera TaxID=253017 RepID=UPI001FB09686|nr:putative glucuronosyltransferase PGSIP8 [Impatiens glandulifera]
MAGRLSVLLLIIINVVVNGAAIASAIRSEHRNAYATMMYMGTPRDYEFYVAARVMLRSLSNLAVDADLVVIASVDVPLPWVQAFEEEDGAKVVIVENLNNPYKNQPNFNQRFKLTLNKLYAWNLEDYDRVPSNKVFKDMIAELENGRQNTDGADQGFIGSYFPELLNEPMFHPPSNNTKLNGNYRLPLGYQMDATYYYLRLRWNVPCGPNSVITFPGAPWLKPWYWWSWPVLPLGLKWHQQRYQTIGYGSEMPLVFLQAAIYLGIIAVTRIARPNLAKLCYKRLADKNISGIQQMGIKMLAMWFIVGSYTIPFFIIPSTVHPIVGWALYLLGAFTLSLVTNSVFLLPILPVLVPWFGIFGVLLVMACPWYKDGVVRALSVFGYGFCAAPALWVAMNKVMRSLRVSIDREVLLPRMADETELSLSGFNKLY